MTELLKPNDLVLFQGDSITDAGRARDNTDHMGWGYAMMIAAWYSARHPENHVRFLNRGISGNRVPDLEARWQPDCIDLKPTVVSILIGINDTWRSFDSGQKTSTIDFEDGYRRILTQVAGKLKARIILLEPFVLHVPDDRKLWRPDLDPKRASVLTLAKEFDATFVAYDEIFAKLATVRGPAFWAADGVHPTEAGHAAMAQAWLAGAGLA